MDQHPVPRQITTFEFKLIGFMTLKQFLYLVVSVPTGFIVFKLFPIPYINIFLGAIVALAGAAFAFVPIQDRPLDVWLRNLFRRLNSPTQYFYHKSNQPLYFLHDLYFLSDPHKITSHIESRKKLAAYLAMRQTQNSQQLKQKQHIQSLLRQNITTGKPTSSSASTVPTTTQMQQSGALQQVIAYDDHEGAEELPGMSTAQASRQPFFMGVVKNSKQMPLPNILIYVKDSQRNPLRLLKTNPHGVFATFSPLPPAEYFVELKDPNGKFFFDTMKVNVETVNPAPYQFYSKELL